MDPITQGLLGAAVSQSIFHHQLGRKAALIGGIAGMLADADFLLFPFAPDRDPFYWHRHFSHSLIFSLIGGFIVLLPFLLWPACRKEGVWKWTYLCAVTGYLTHGPLDLMTSPGTMVLWPFSFEKYALDAIGVIDPFFSLALLVGLMITLLWDKAWAIRNCLLLSMLYLGIGLYQNHRAIDYQKELAKKRGQTWVEGRAVPIRYGILHWYSQYRTRDKGMQRDTLKLPLWGSAKVSSTE